MKKVSLLVGLLVIAAVMSGCAAFDHSADRSGRYDGGSGSYGGHSHH